MVLMLQHALDSTVILFFGFLVGGFRCKRRVSSEDCTFGSFHLIIVDLPE